jgi:hypothetical protein
MNFQSIHTTSSRAKDNTNSQTLRHKLLESRVNHVMRIENPSPLVCGGQEVRHHNLLTNPLMNEKNRICNYKTTKTMRSIGW